MDLKIPNLTNIGKRFCKINWNLDLVSKVFEVLIFEYSTVGIVWYGAVFLNHYVTTHLMCRKVYNTKCTKIYILYNDIQVMCN